MHWAQRSSESRRDFYILDLRTATFPPSLLDAPQDKARDPRTGRGVPLLFIHTEDLNFKGPTRHYIPVMPEVNDSGNERKTLLYDLVRMRKPGPALTAPFAIYRGMAMCCRCANQLPLLTASLKNVLCAHAAAEPTNRVGKLSASAKKQGDLARTFLRPQGSESEQSDHGAHNRAFWKGKRDGKPKQ